jgi:hypothetical protein
MMFACTWNCMQLSQACADPRTSIPKAANDTNYHKQPVECIGTPAHDNSMPQESHAGFQHPQSAG